MNRDLFLAILAMDSYNRGYGEGLDGLSSRNGTQIGNATIRADSSVLTIDNVRQDIAAGFYAIAYDVSGVAGFADGERVIAYRGSDYQDTNGAILRSNDLWQGYPAQP